MQEKQIIEISKVLSNPTRLKILQWLKEPEKFFPSQGLGHFNDGVCASFITDRTELTQPTISSFLSMMEKSGILSLTRHGKWSYYKRNDQVINQYLSTLKNKF